MAALLTAQQITAVETRIASLTTLAGEVRDVLNGLFTADPGNKAHPAWRPLQDAHASIKQSILNLRNGVLSNDDAYGK